MYDAPRKPENFDVISENYLAAMKSTSKASFAPSLRQCYPETMSGSGRLKITMDARLWKHSGIGVYTQNFVKRIAPLIPDVEWTFLVQESERATFEKLPYSKSLIAADSLPYTFREQAQLIRSIPAGQDYVWSPHWNVSLLSRQPMIVTIHDLFHQHRGRLATWNQFLGSRPYLAKLLINQPRILTVSQFSARELAKIGFKDITTIPNFVDEIWTRKPAERTSSRPYFIFVSNIKPHKNLQTAIQAFKLITDQRDDVDFVVVGKAEDMFTIDQRTFETARKMEPRVRIVGAISLSELQSLMQNAVAAICPSLYEGFGLPVLEAMKFGLPVIASRIASHQEVGEGAVLYFDPSDAADCAKQMLNVLNDPDLRLKVIERGEIRAASFNMARAGEAYLKFFNSLREPAGKVANISASKSAEPSGPYRLIVAMATFNRLELLQKSLDSILLADRPPSVEFHLFDDASTDIDWAALRLRYPFINDVHYAVANVGADQNILRILEYFAGRKNKFSHLLILDADCLVTHDLFMYLRTRPPNVDTIWTAYRSRFHSEKHYSETEVIKSSAGALGLYLQKNQVIELIKRPLPSQFTDWRLVLRFRELGGKILAPVNSKIEHIGWYGSNNRIGHPDRSRGFKPTNDTDRSLVQTLEKNLKRDRRFGSVLLEFYKTAMNSVLRFKIRCLFAAVTALFGRVP